MLVYLTALPFTPVETILSKTFTCHDTPQIVGGFNNSWPSLLQMIQVSENIEVKSVAFFPDGAQIVTASDNLIHVWDATTGAEVLSPLVGHTAKVNSSIVSVDGIHIVSGSDDHTVRLWDATTGEALQLFEGHSGSVLAVAICSDGTRIASGSEDQTVRMWISSSTYMIFAHEGLVYSVAFTLDGRYLASGSDDATVHVWDVISGGEPVYQLQDHGDAISSVAVSPDGSYIASSSWDSIRISDTNTGSHNLVIKTQDSTPVSSVAFFPDLKHISAISDERIYTWDLISGMQIFVSTVHKWMHSMALSSNGEQFLIGYHDGTVGLWDATSLDAEVSDSEANKGRIMAISFTPDGQQIALCHRKDFGIQLWDTQSGLDITISLQGHKDFIRCLAMSPCGKIIASCSSDMTVRLWNLSSGVAIVTLRGHTGFVSCMTFSPDGMQIASGSWDRTVRLWNVTSGSQIMSPLCGHRKDIRVLAFSLDGTRLVSGDWAGSVRMWDIMLHTQIGCFFMSSDYIPSSLTFSTDGNCIIVKCQRGMYIWDIDQGCLITTPDYLHPECTLKDPIIITPDLWIVDVATRTILHKLPSFVSIRDTHHR